MMDLRIVLLRYAKEYEKNYAGVVRLIDKENGGHGSTINRGIKKQRESISRQLMVMTG